MILWSYTRICIIIVSPHCIGILYRNQLLANRLIYQNNILYDYRTGHCIIFILYNIHVYK